MLLLGSVPPFVAAPTAAMESALTKRFRFAYTCVRTCSRAHREFATLAANGCICLVPSCFPIPFLSARGPRGAPRKQAAWVALAAPASPLPVSLGPSRARPAQARLARPAGVASGLLALCSFRLCLQTRQMPPGLRPLHGFVGRNPRVTGPIVPHPIGNFATIGDTLQMPWLGAWGCGRRARAPFRPVPRPPPPRCPRLPPPPGLGSTAIPAPGS